MTAFDDLMAADARATFLQEAEDALYHNAVYEADSEDSAGRPIKIQIERNPPMPPQEAQQTIAPYLRVLVLNDGADGISMQELDKGRDTIELPERVGDTALKTYKIRAVLRQDAAMLWLKVE